MTNEASTSNPSFIVNVGEAYPYPSLINPNIVTVKLSGKNKYNMWKTQMLCLLKSHQMYGFIDGQFPFPAGNGKEKVEDLEAWIISDSLVKGWILGSLSEEAFNKVVNHLTDKQKNPDFTAKDLWDELQRSYGPSLREQAVAESPIMEEDEFFFTMGNPFIDTFTPERVDEFSVKWVYNNILKGNTRDIIDSVNKKEFNPWDTLTNNGNTVLHVAVGSSTKNHELLKELLKMTPAENTLLDVVNSDRSSLLHVAAIGGNTEVVDILVERNPELLLAKDKEGHTPLALSVSNMHTKTSHCLFKHMKEKGHDAPLRGEVIMTCKTFKQQEKEKEYDALFTGKSGEDLVVLAISCQDFSLAEKIIDKYPDAILDDSDAVLTALAQNFPRELNFWERGWKEKTVRIIGPYRPTLERLWNYADSSRVRQPLKIFPLFFVGLCYLATWFYQFGKVLVRPFVKDTSQIYFGASFLSFQLCYKVKEKGNPSTHHQYYNSSIFEATRRNSSTFIRHIMWRFPDAIWSTNEDGHNFIQYSVINRSEKIYNLLYEMSEHKNIYKTIKDSSGNNLLHLAARLAPTDKLNLIRGAALRIQRELQWFKVSTLTNDSKFEFH